MINELLNKRKRFKGQGMVELALVLPLFLLLLYGIFEVGRLVFMYSAVLNASREAARYAGAADAVRANDASYLEYYKDCEGIRARAQNISGFVNLTATNAITISYDSGPGTGSIETSCEALRSSGRTLALGDRVNVTVTAIFSPIVPVLNIAEIPISSTTSRSIVAGINIWEN